MNLQRKTVYNCVVYLETDDASDLINRSFEELTDDIMAECIDVTVHAEEWHIDMLKESTQSA